MKFGLESFTKFSADAQRVIANLETSYEQWVAVARELKSLPVSMFWAKRAGVEYLTIKQESKDPGTTRGKRSEETEARFREFLSEKQALRQRAADFNKLISERAGLYRRLRLPIILDRQAEILRDLDVEGKLGTDLMVVGTNAFSAYEVHCGAKFPTGNEETEDFDLAWCRGHNASSLMAISGTGTRKQKTLFEILLGIDSSFRINKVKPYQAVAGDGYPVELLAAPSRHPLPQDEVFDPMATLIEQEWLLKGRPVSQVVATQRGRACPLYVPDPRWMALHKIWLSEKPERKPSKKEKDARQGNVLLDAVRYFLPGTYPLDIDFVLDLPDELRPYFDRWAKERNFLPENIGR